jgi:para-aminobenzoate synthetase/4-amino-4-deoxychorismate lyase
MATTPFTATAALFVRPMPVRLALADVVRRVASRDRVTAWSGSWSPGGLVTCDPVAVVRPGTAEAMRVLATQPQVRPDPEHPDAVGGGWFGYLSFPASRPTTWPRASLGWYRDVLRHDGNRWWYEALLDTGGDEDAARAGGASSGVRTAFDEAAACARRDLLLAALQTPAAPVSARLTTRVRPDARTRATHVAAVERCRQAIRRGDIYQANVATRLELTLHGSPHEAWARLVERLDPARACLVADPAGTAVSASPELFLRRSDRSVRTDPIKGTRPRRGDPDDARERAVLRASDKDAAENVMIVDLMRNDLGRVCATGSVRVPALLDVQPHPGVWHLVSTVCGTLADGRDDADLLAATFPPGSVTGTPKLRATEVIEQVEAHPRGLFTGALGYAGPLVGLETAVAIRTLEVEPGGRTRLWVGGGITADSMPAAEWSECLDKADPILRVLGTPPRGRTVPPLAAASGVREVVVVAAGRPVLLAEHVERLRRSYRDLYGAPLTADVVAAVRAAAAQLPRGGWAVVIDAGPATPDRVRATVRPVPAAGGTVVLAPSAAPATVGHSMTDRGALDTVEATVPPGVEPLLVDRHSDVLGTSRSNVLAVRDGVVYTPPLDGRVVPGTVRQLVLDALDDARVPYVLRPLPLALLPRMTAVVVTDALRGIRQVTAVRGVAQWPPLLGSPAGRDVVAARVLATCAEVVTPTTAPSSTTELETDHEERAG